MTTTAERHPPGGRDAVAIVLAVGAALALLTITVAAVINALKSEDAALSENATQILSTAFGAMFGTLGTYLGFRTGDSRRSSHSIDVELEPKIDTGHSPHSNATTADDTSPSA